MPMDGCLIHYLINELNEEIKSFKINKVYQIAPMDLVLQLRGKNKKGLIVNKQLFLSSSLDSPRCFITEKKYQNPESPTAFCMLLRKYIERGIIANIIQKENDRIIEFHIVTVNELEDEESYILLMELMGRNSNIILLNKDYLIIDAMRKIPPTMEHLRTIIPHAKYVYPESRGVNPFGITNKDEININNLQGVSTPLKDCLRDLTPNDFISFLNQEIKPVIYDTGKRNDFYAFPLDERKVIKHFLKISAMLDDFYNQTIKEVNYNANLLEKHIRKEIVKLKAKLVNLEDDLLTANQNLIYNTYGMLLQANLYQIKKGMTYIWLNNYLENGEPICINLDPLKEPSANLKSIFNKGRKAKNAIIEVNKQKEIATKELNYLDTILFQLSIASNSEANEIKDELIKNNYIKGSKGPKAKIKRVFFDCYKVDNHDILIGKCNTQNEKLTHSIASSNDYWFHAKNIPGSHVIVKCQKDEELSEKVIRFAANCAAYYSKASKSNSVPVDYTRIKFIKKIPGEKGYHVTYTNQKTIYIDPEQKLLENCKQATF